MDRHRFDADPDPNFHVDADQNDAGSHAGPTPGFTHVRKSEYFLNFYLYSQHCQFKNFLEKSEVYQLFHLLEIETDSGRPDPDRHALDANPVLDPDPAK